MKKTSRRKPTVPLNVPVQLWGKCPKCKQKKELNVFRRETVKMIICTDCCNKYYGEV